MRTTNYYIHEVRAYISVLHDRITAIENSIDTLKDSGRPGSAVLIEHLVMWRNKLLLILGELNRLSNLLDEGRDVLVSLTSCRAKENVYSIISTASQEDPIYQNLRSLLAGLMASLEDLCGRR